MTRFKTSVLLFVLAIAYPYQIAISQGRVHGTVKEAIHKKPIQGVSIELMTKIGTIPSEKLSTFSDENGEYELSDVPLGEWRIRASYIDGDLFRRQIMTPKITIGSQSHVFHFKMGIDRGEGPVVKVRAESDTKDETVKVAGVIQTRNGEPLEKNVAYVTKLVNDSAFTSIPAFISLIDRENYKRERNPDSILKTDIQSDGRFEFPAVPRGLYVLDVMYMAYGPVNRQIRITEPVHVSIEVSKPVPSNLRIEDERGERIENAVRTGRRTKYTGDLAGFIYYKDRPAVGAIVQLLDERRDVVLSVWPGRVDTDGSYSITTINPEIYGIRIDYKGVSYEVDSVGIAIGQNELNISYGN